MVRIEMRGRLIMSVRMIDRQAGYVPIGGQIGGQIIRGETLETRGETLEDFIDRQGDRWFNRGMG